MSDDLKEVFGKAIKGIRAVGSFPYDNYANRLHNKVRNVLQQKDLQTYIDRAPTYPEDDPDPDNWLIDIFAIGDLFSKLSVPAVSGGISSVDDKYDSSEHLKQYVSNENSKARYLEVITNLMGFCLGEHINRELKSQGTLTIDDLWHYGDFQDFCLEAVTEESFITNEIRSDMGRGDHLFSIAWLMIADYMQDRDHVYRTAPSGSNIEFQAKASCKTLHKWSYTLWANEGKGDPARMDDIVKFCGRVATIGLCPPNATTNLQQPAPTWSVTKAFYDSGFSLFSDDDYNKELQDSLDRLQHEEDVINEWHSYCLALTNAWESEIVPYWNAGMYRAFVAKQFDLIKFWEVVAYDDQDNFGWGIDYLPVTGQPNLPSYKSLENTILPGTKITLSDGTSRPIEAVSLEDEVLAFKDLKTSAFAFRRPIRQPLQADIVGFNGEVPWALSSQVFHTTTGLRAVDPEAAQTLNPYRRIGKLAIGHLLFRLQENEYVTVEIKSIDRAKQLFESAFTLSLVGDLQAYHADGYLVDMNSASHTLKETAEMLRKVPGDQRLGLLSHIQELQSTFKNFDTLSIYQRLNWELFGQYNSPDGQEPSLRQSLNTFNYKKHIETSKALSITKGIPIDRLARGFRLKAHHPDRLPAEYELPALGLVDGHLIIQGEVQLRSSYDSQKRHLRWTRELKQINLFEHGVFEICSRAIAGKGVIYISPEAEAEVAHIQDEVHPFEAKACSLDKTTRSVEIMTEDEDEWEAYGQWQVTIDRTVWPPDTERTEPDDPIDGGILEDGYWATQVEVPSVNLLLIEQLRNQINEKFGQQLGSFYDVTSKMKDGEQTFSVEFKRASLLPFVSDSGLDVKKTFNVGFKSDLDIDVTLPSLFQQMTFTMDVFYENFTGYLYEYDPTKRGYKGNRHLITGTIINSKIVTATRSEISRAYEVISKPGKAHIFDERLQPAIVTKSLLALSEPSVKDLVRFVGYQETSLHNDSQLLIRSMMYYHMDDTQREKILQVAKPNVPDELPAALAGNLPAKLKTFFKEKYGPAFICRYVGRTQKYMKDFTDQEMKNLWYWWQGNGKNSLSQSEEYNDINRLSSREAMKRRYSDNLEPYLQSDPDSWAQRLYDEVTGNKHLLNNWVHFPIPDDGNNVINKQCNILDALSPSADWSQKFFNTFMAYAINEGASSADIEPGNNQDTKYNWLYDSMSDLIQAVLNDDPTISNEVKQAILEDINDFEEQNNLNQQADAQKRAAAILEKSTQFIQELAGWFSYIGKGIQSAFAGTALWKWAGQAFDQAAELVSSLPAVGKLKGISSICMVGVSIGIAAVSLWGLVNDWSNLPDAKRGVVIIEIVRMVVGGVDKAIGAFKEFKSKPASTPTDELNMEALNEGLAEEITENSGKMADVAQSISGEEDYRTAIADGIRGEGIPTDFDGKEGWNEEIGDIANEVPPGYEDVAKKFNISGAMLRMLNAILGIGLVVAMSFSLATDWSSLSDPGKVLGVLNIIVQGLTVLLDVIDAGVEMGLWAVTGTLSVALPILGAVLAVIGVILMVVQLFINLFVKAQEPPDPISDFIDDVAHSLISTFDIAPRSQLNYSVSTSSVNAGKVSTITITGKNESSSDVTISYTAITLYSGDDDVCLFRNGADGTDSIALALDNDPNKNDNGHTFVTPRSITTAQLPIPSRLGNTSAYYEYDLRAAGPPKDTSKSLGYLILKAGESFQSIWTAKINNKGDTKERSTSWIEIIEAGLKDSCQSQFVLQRI
ncbi:hypothetical protein MFRU_007g02140 [Monilinia fructicola]|nr:hypothetical protein MFRU_007g02140 [Monilinia fructicola]